MEEVYQDTHISNNMKAQIVKENLEFEKGKDTQVALGLGIKSEVSNMRKRLSEMYDDAFSERDNPYYSGIVEALDYAMGLIDELSIMKK